MEWGIPWNHYVHYESEWRLARPANTHISAEAFSTGIKGNLPDHNLTARCRDTYKLPLPSGIEESSPQPCKSGFIH